MNFIKHSPAVGGLAFAAAALIGCANMSGLDAGSTYSCKAPEGVKCDSVSGIYYNAVQNNLPGQQKQPLGVPQPPAPGMLEARVPATATQPAAGPHQLQTVATRQPAANPGGYVPTPLRAAPRVYRLWIKPWEDAERDLNSESLVYVQIDGGRWIVDHVQRQVRDAYAPIRPAKLQTTAASEPAPEPQTRDRPMALSPLDTNAAVQQAISSFNAQPPRGPGDQ